MEIYCNSEGETKILEGESGGTSMKGAFPVIQKLVTTCHGIISMEHSFFGAFSKVPVENNYSVFEIPPFGSYSDKDGLYKGLKKERVNCIFISNEFETTSRTKINPRSCGLGTNVGIRYKNYILPYSKYLINQGAKIYKIPKYGTAIIL